MTSRTATAVAMITALCTCLPAAQAGRLFESRMDYLVDFPSGYIDNPAPIIASGDFDGDGHRDLASAERNTDSVAVLLGDGDAVFRPAVGYGVGHVPFSLAAGDLDGDGCADLVTANHGDSTYSVLMSNGDGTFADAVHWGGTGFQPTTVALGDLNGDGDLDLVVGNSNGELRWGRGNGDGTFTGGGNRDIGNKVGSIFVGDIDSDGIPDLAAVDTSGDQFAVLPGNGNGTFRETVYTPIAEPWSFDIGDLDNDGHSDLVLISRALVDEACRVYLGSGAGFLPTSAPSCRNLESTRSRSKTSTATAAWTWPRPITHRSSPDGATVTAPSARRAPTGPRGLR